MCGIHVFGSDNQWALSVDDGYLLLHPQYSTDPEKISEHIWKEAFEEINKLGGFDAAISKIQKTIGDCCDC